MVRGKEGAGGLEGSGADVSGSGCVDACSESGGEGRRRGVKKEEVLGRRSGAAEGGATAPPLGMAKPLPMQQTTPPPAPPAARAERQWWRGGARRGVGEGILRICCSCDARRARCRAGREMRRTS